MHNDINAVSVSNPHSADNVQIHLLRILQRNIRAFECEYHVEPICTLLFRTKAAEHGQTHTMQLAVTSTVRTMMNAAKRMVLRHFLQVAYFTKKSEIVFFEVAERKPCNPIFLLYLLFVAPAV